MVLSLIIMSENITITVQPNTGSANVDLAGLESLASIDHVEIEADTFYYSINDASGKKLLSAEEERGLWNCCFPGGSLCVDISIEDRSHKKLVEIRRPFDCSTIWPCSSVKLSKFVLSPFDV